MNAPPTTEIYTLSLHDALPISSQTGGQRLQNQILHLKAAAAHTFDNILRRADCTGDNMHPYLKTQARSEEHTSELQSRGHLVCRLLLEKKKKLNRDTRGSTLHT